MKPSKEAIADFLLQLRDSGITNMWGAAPYLMDQFGMNRYEAKDALLDWIKSFDQRATQ
jgi:hypothetical protein